MLSGALTVENLRATYLRGINLGDAWHGPGADAALAQMLDVHLARAESLMNIQFRPAVVATAPEPGQAYDVLGPLLPYVPPTPEQTLYLLRLGYHDVQALTRVRLYRGLDTSVPPAPVYTTLDLAQIGFAPPDETVRIPVSLVPDPTLAQGWAVDYTVGLGALPVEVAAWVNLSVASEVLSAAGSAADVTGGGERRSLTMDDVREDVWYGRGEGGGLYGPTIRQYQALRDEIDLVKLRMRYQGMAWYVHARSPAP
jgi:hypothetical protein